MKIKFPVLYSQFDSRWSNKLLGFNTEPRYNMYNYGCLVSTLAMVCKYYGKDETPDSLNDKLKSINGFVNGGLYVWGSLTKIYPDIKERVVNTPNLLTDGQLNEIKTGLDRAFPVMVHLDYNPKTVQSDMHFSPLVNYNPKDENDFTLADTLGARIHSMKEYLGWFKPSVRNTIDQYVIYEGQIPKEEEPATKPPTEVKPVPVVSNPTSSLPSNYDTTVKMATQYKEVVSYLELSKSPEDAMFEDCKRVIAGYKSAKTDYGNKMIEAEKKAATYAVQIQNLEADLSNLNDEMTRREKLHKAEFDALNQARPNTDEVLKQYQGVYDELKGKYDIEVQTVKELRIELAQKTAEKASLDEEVKDSVVIKRSALNSIINSIKNFLTAGLH